MQETTAAVQDMSFQSALHGFEMSLLKCSMGVMTVLLCDVFARRIAALMGWAVCIPVQDCNSVPEVEMVGGKSVSICSADVAVARKAPTIAFIASLHRFRLRQSGRIFASSEGWGQAVDR